MFFHNYPYSDAHELNLDWIIKQVKEFTSTMETFVNIASIKYADPILWNITAQYEQNTVVLDPLTGDGYLSTKPVPVGISLSNTDYWTAIFNYESRIQDVIQLIDAVDDRVDVEITDRTNADNALGGRIDDEIADRIAADAGLQSQIDALSNVSGYKDDFANIKNLGAVGDGTVHTLAEYYATLADAQADFPAATALTQTIDWAVIQKAVNDGNRIYIPSGNYMINSTITIPNTASKKLVISGDGVRQSILSPCNDNMILFNYLRNATPNTGAILELNDLAFVTSNTNVTGVKFYGVEVGGLRYEDNWLKVDNIYAYGLYRVFDLSYCGQTYFNRVYAQNSGIMFRLLRDASFIHFYKCMALGCANFVYADDPIADAVSNGLYFEDCQAVLCSNLPYRILGWQGVYFTNCSADLGTGTTAQIVLYKCMDFAINGCWIAGDHVSGSMGIRIWDTINGTVSGCSIVNCDHGIRVDGLSGSINGLNINSNVFEGHSKNDVLIVNCEGIEVVSNFFKDAITLSGTDAPVYATGADHVVLMFNEFKNASYTVNCGTNYIASANLFNVT